MTTATQEPVQMPAPQASYLDDLPERKISRLEKLLGPENYRILRGILTNPLSVFGISLIGFFFVIAIAAPLIAPKSNQREPFMTPRDGFGPVPKPPGSEWKTRPIDEPFWFKLVGKEKWTAYIWHNYWPV